MFVANDTQPNKLYRNNRNGTFTDVGLPAGVAYSEDGVARGAMGVDAADYDRSGRPHLLVGNFSNQMLGLYHNEGNGLFVDEAPRSTVGRASRCCSLAFGVFFFDYDLDGWPDIFAANGHIEEEIGRVQPKVQYRQPPLLFRNLGNAHASRTRAPRWARSSRGRSSRAAPPTATTIATAISTSLLTTNHGPAYLYRNDGGNRNNWIAVRTRGVKSNRDGIGAIVRVDERRRAPVADGAQRIELRVAERLDAHLRSGRRHRRIVGRDRVAERRSRSRDRRSCSTVDHD